MRSLWSYQIFKLGHGGLENCLGQKYRPISSVFVIRHCSESNSAFLSFSIRLDKFNYFVCSSFDTLALAISLSMQTILLAVFSLFQCRSENDVKFIRHTAEVNKVQTKTKKRDRTDSYDTIKECDVSSADAVLSLETILRQSWCLGLKTFGLGLAVVVLIFTARLMTIR